MGDLILKAESSSKCPNMADICNALKEMERMCHNIYSGRVHGEIAIDMLYI